MYNKWHRRNWEDKSLPGQHFSKSSCNYKGTLIKKFSSSVMDDQAS